MGKKNENKNRGPRDQHFVPRCYLSEFTDPNTPEGQEPYVWVFDKDGNNPKRRLPKIYLPKPISTLSNLMAKEIFQ